jgi:dihydroorotate dehydrogenase
MPYQSLLRPLFFRLEPERAHYLAMDLLGALRAVPGGRGLQRALFGVDPPASAAVEAFGLRFPHPVGLAAGFDKDARWVDALADLGFAFVEIGTVTPRPQPGNPKPRLFRLPADKALVNRMGFNNGGADAAAERLARRRSRVIVGGNIGKNKDTPNDRATDDYRAAFRALHPVVDYLVVNVSSPNTPGLRALQDREPLTRLLATLQEDNAATGTPKPVLLKIAPDLGEGQLEDLVALTRETGTAGLIVANTTVARDGLRTPAARLEAIGAGGLSGDPVRDRSTELIRRVRALAGPELPIVGVGGIRTAEHVREKLDAGATLVQVWTGFVYEGPGMVRALLR